MGGIEFHNSPPVEGEGNGVGDGHKLEVIVFQELNVGLLTQAKKCVEG